MIQNLIVIEQDIEIYVAWSFVDGLLPTHLSLNVLQAI